MRDFTIRSDPSFGAFQIMKLFLDDWISVNVLRSVALSTNSVAASVPTMQQQQHQQQQHHQQQQPRQPQFFALSPMAGQESFNPVETQIPQNNHHTILTPTTTHMLNALQHGTFPSETSTYNPDTYNPLSFMDSNDQHGESIVDPGLAFPGYNGTGSFDVPTFTPQDLLEQHDSPLVKAETAH
jgi:regulatory factor X